MADLKEEKQAVVPVEDIEAQGMEELEGRFDLIKIPNDEELTKAIENMKRALTYIEFVQNAVIARSKPGDWVLRDGKPYFTEAGCNRFRGPFRIYFKKDLQSWTIDAQGNRREISDRNVYEGDVRFIFFAGTAGSALLGSEGYFVGGARLPEPGEKGFWDKGDILNYTKKARANYDGLVIRKITGMENLTLEDLKAQGVDVSKIEKVEYVKTEKADSGEAQELWNWILDLNDGDVKRAEDYLFKLTDNPEKKFKGKARPSQLSAGQMKWIRPKVHDEWKKKFPEKAKETKAPESNAAASQTNDGFLKSVQVLRPKISDDDYAEILNSFGVMKPEEVQAEKHNDFLRSMSKKVKEGK